MRHGVRPGYRLCNSVVGPSLFASTVSVGAASTRRDIWRRICTRQRGPTKETQHFLVADLAEQGTNQNGCRSRHVGWRCAAIPSLDFVFEFFLFRSNRRQWLFQFHFGPPVYRASIVIT